MHKSTIFRWLSVGVAMSASLSVPAVAHAQHALSVNVPAGDLATALDELARQSGLELIYGSEQLAGLTTRGVNGQFTSQEAVARLLIGTPLTSSTDTSGAVLISPRYVAPPVEPAEKAPQKTSQATASGPLQLDSSGGWFRRILLAQTNTPASSSNVSSGRSAQEEPAVSDTLEEVIVTAQMRQQSLKDVPISMTAFTEADLAKYRVQTFEDFILMTPGVQYVQTDDTDKTVSIRGIHGNVGGLYQTVGVTIDDATLVATYNGFMLATRLFDVERVEVLRGPQGVLTGSNSTSGTINIITKKPKLGVFEAEATLDYSRFNTQLMRGVLNTPLSDTLALRTTAYVESSDGALRNAGPGGGGSTEDHIGGRIAGRWQPMEALTLDASFNFEHQKYGSPNMLPLKADFTNPDFADQYWVEMYGVNRAALEAVGGNLARVEYIQDAGVNGATIFSDIREKTEHKLWFGTLRADYALARHNVSVMYAHYEHDVETLLDEDKSPFPMISYGLDGGPETNYAEARITSNYEGRLNWVAGVSYMKEHRILDQWNDRTASWLPAYFNGEDFGEVMPTGNLASLPYYRYYWDTTLEELQSTAAFANLFFDFTPRLHLAMGGRISSNKTATQSQTELDYTGGVDGSSFGPFNDPITADETHFDPRVALNFDLTDDVTTYVQFATGYRAGYGNTGTEVELGLAPAEVGGETVKNYEIGLKGRFFDGRATLSAAVFYMDYSDMQLTVSRFVDLTEYPELPQAEIFYDDNVQSSTSMGFEAEGSLMLTRGLVASFGVSYVKSEIDELVDGDTVYSDVPFPNVPTWTANSALQYTRAVTDELDANFLAQYTYRDSSRDDFPWRYGGPIDRIPSYGLFDLSVGVDSERWSAVAYIENVFDKTYWLDSYLDYGVAGATVAFNPRMMGIRLTFRM